MHKILILNVFLFIVAFSAAVQACQRSGPIDIEVYKQILPTQYDFTKNSLELDYIGKGAYSPYGEGHKTFLRGLTVGRHGIDYKVYFKTQKSNSVSFACLYVSKVSVTFNYNPTVYVSSEYPQGSPIFRRVLAHEEHHVDITRQTLDEFSAKVQNRLQYADFGMRAFGPYELSALESEKQYIKQRVKIFMEAFNREMHAVHQRRHNHFDDATLMDKRAYNRQVARKLEEIFKLNH